MTTKELRSHFNRVFGMHRDWPRTYEIDAITYANCCQYVFARLYDDCPDEHDIIDHISGKKLVRIHLGPNKSLMFKSVELILKP